MNNTILKRHILYILLLPFHLLLFLCMSCKDSDVKTIVKEESLAAKKALQGVWLGEDESVTMRVHGDTIYYADTVLAPVYFKIIDDSLVLRGAHEMRYGIVKQTSNLFQFTNHMGDVVKLTKSHNHSDTLIFEKKESLKVNQNKLIKRDSVITRGEHRYHIYVQVNPSTYKVIRTFYNQDGMMVDKVYYDNIVNVCVYDGGKRVFFRDMYKADFKKYIPTEYFQQSVLSDIVIEDVSADSINLQAYICVPESPTSYVVNMMISETGEMRLSIE